MKVIRRVLLWNVLLVLVCFSSQREIAAIEQLSAEIRLPIKEKVAAETKVEDLPILKTMKWHARVAGYGTTASHGVQVPVGGQYWSTKEGTVSTLILSEMKSKKGTLLWVRLRAANESKTKETIRPRDFSFIDREGNALRLGALGIGKDSVPTAILNDEELKAAQGTEIKLASGATTDFLFVFDFPQGKDLCIVQLTPHK
jgi:hypothetical protein